MCVCVCVCVCKQVMIYSTLCSAQNLSQDAWLLLYSSEKRRPSAVRCCLPVPTQEHSSHSQQGLLLHILGLAKAAHAVNSGKT